MVVRRGEVTGEGCVTMSNPDANIDWSECHVVVDGTTVLAPCFSFTLIMEGADSEGILDFYTRARGALGDGLTHYKAESMKRAAKLTPRAEGMVAAWTKNPREDKFYSLRMTGCPEQEGVTPSTLSLAIWWNHPSSPATLAQRRITWRIAHERGASHIFPLTTLRVALPLSHELVSNFGRLVEWVRDFHLVRTGNFVTGSAGYSLVDYGVVAEPHKRAAMTRRMSSVCRRHPGLDYQVSTASTRYLYRWDPARDDIVKQFIRVSWLTLLGAETISFLGGRDALERELTAEPRVMLYPAGDGLLVRAGEAPEVGDLARSDVPGVPRSIARVLRPARLPKIWTYNRQPSWEQEWLELWDSDYGAP